MHPENSDDNVLQTMRPPSRDPTADDSDEVSALALIQAPRFIFRSQQRVLVEVSGQWAVGSGQ